MATVSERPSPPSRSPLDGDRKGFWESEGRYGVMFSPEYSWSPVECTKRAYGDSNKRKGYRPSSDRSLFFHTKFLGKETALKCIGAMPRLYNGFSRRAVEEAVEAMPSDIEVSVAREGSPCLYIWTDDPDAVRDALDSIEPTEDELRKGVECNEPLPTPPNELGRVSRFPSLRVRSDEGEEGFDDWYLVRVWWD